MSRLSSKDADRLRFWLQLTSAVYSSKGNGVVTPSKPVGWMILGYLALRPEQAASYADLREFLDVKSAASLSQAIARLEGKGLLSSSVLNADPRAKEARLTVQGWNAVGRILHAAFPIADS